MNSKSTSSTSVRRRAASWLICAGICILGIGVTVWAVDYLRGDITCEQTMMRFGDTCAYIKVKGYSAEAHTPAGVTPIRKPPQPARRPGQAITAQDVHRTQQIHIRDLDGMRSDRRKEAFKAGGMGVAIVLTSGYVAVRAGLRRSGG